MYLSVSTHLLSTHVLGPIKQLCCQNLYVAMQSAGCCFKIYRFHCFIFADVIIPAINSSMDSPIATASCASTQQRTGSDDGEFGDVVEDVSCVMNIS